MTKNVRMSRAATVCRMNEGMTAGVGVRKKNDGLMGGAAGGERENGAAIGVEVQKRKGRPAGAGVGTNETRGCWRRGGR